MTTVLSAFHPTLRLRLTLLYGALFLLAGVLLLATSYTLVRHSLKRSFEPPRFGIFSANEGDGAAPDGSTSLVVGQVPPPDSIETGTPSEQVLMSDQMLLEDGRTLDEALQDYQDDLISDALNELLAQSGIALALTGLGAVGLGWLVAGRVLRPMRRITLAAQHASDSNLHERVNLRGPRDELKELADTFDRMLGRLDVAFESQRRFAAAASHELRTPIAIIRAEADLALADSEASERERRLADTVRTAALRGEGLIASLLALARSQSTMLDRTPLDLADLTGDVVGEQARQADAAGVEMDLSLAGTPVVGDRMLLERLVGNLVENAIRYNQPGGWVRVAAGTESNEALLRVANSGPVVRDSEIARLFEPFHRDTNGHRDAPAGYGLGLAIVRAIVIAHDGAVNATPRETGGLEVVVRLPLCGSSHPGG